MADSNKPSALSTGSNAADFSSPASRRSGEYSQVPVLYRTLSAHTAADLQSRQFNKIKKSSTSPARAPIKAHLMREQDLYLAYSTDPRLGLDASTVSRKSAAIGPNRLSPPKANYLIKFLGYVFGGFNAIMWLACILIYLSYEPLGESDPLPINLGVGTLIFIIIMISSAFYAYVDWSASKIMNSIQSLVAHKAIVIRDGVEQQIDAEELVPGDVVILSIGQRVPADIRLIDVSSDLKFDRSLLTGESKLVGGAVEPTDENPLETRNLALSSTFVVRGRAKGIVYEIGDNTIIGEIVRLSGRQKVAMTPIQREINIFTLIITGLALSFFSIAMLVWGVYIQYYQVGYEDAAGAISNAIGCLTAFVPQGLPVCFALSLTIIARRMAARSVLVKNLSTIETLGCMSVLCSDKTGTLTVGRMIVQSALFPDKSIQVGENTSSTGNAASSSSATKSSTISLNTARTNVLMIKRHAHKQLLTDGNKSAKTLALLPDLNDSKSTVEVIRESHSTDQDVAANSLNALASEPERIVSPTSSSSSTQSYPSALVSVHAIAAICNDASFLPGNENQPIEDRPINGDTTDAAILRFAERFRPSISSVSAQYRSAQLAAHTLANMNASINHPGSVAVTNSDAIATPATSTMNLPAVAADQDTYFATDQYTVLFTMAFNSKNKFMAKIVQFGPTIGADASSSSAAANTTGTAGAGAGGRARSTSVSSARSFNPNNIGDTDSENIVLLVKGAPDILMEMCSNGLLFDGTCVSLKDEADFSDIDGGEQKASNERNIQTYRARMAQLQEDASSEGLRVLALCRRSLRGIALPLGNQDELEKLVVNELMHDLTLVGLLSICDPPRSDVPAAVRAMRQASVRVFMVTGDFELTAASIAHQVGIITASTVNRLSDLPSLRGTYKIGSGKGGKKRSKYGMEAIVDNIKQWTSRLLSGSNRRDTMNLQTISVVNNADSSSSSAAAVAKQGSILKTSVLKNNAGGADGSNASSSPESNNATESSELPYDKSECRPKMDDPARAIVIRGADLGSIGDPDWDFIAAYFSEIVFARTTPEQKMLIVEKLKARGDNTVAVTGDGTNDAPALKAADIGVAMGSGTDVAKEAASIILLNSDFSSILVGIESGRLVFENLKKVVIYLMPSGTYAEFMAVVAAVFFGMQIPLSSFQQVLFSVTNDIVMAISLMYEKAESDLMKRPPRNVRLDHLTDWRFFFQIYVTLGLPIWICAMAMWFYYMSEQGIHFYDLMFAYANWGSGLSYSASELTGFVNTGQCIYYVTLAICQFGTLLAVRNRRVSILQSNPFWGPRQNLVIPFSMIASILVCIITFYGYYIQQIFGTGPIPTKFWFIPFGFAAGVLLIDETRKAYVRAYPKSFVAWLAW